MSDCEACTTCATCGRVWCREDETSPGEGSGICRDCYEADFDE
jgi:hypothetical protein